MQAYDSSLKYNNFRKCVLFGSFETQHVGLVSCQSLHKRNMYVKTIIIHKVENLRSRSGSWPIWMMSVMMSLTMSLRLKPIVKCYVMVMMMWTLLFRWIWRRCIGNYSRYGTRLQINDIPSFLRNRTSFCWFRDQFLQIIQISNINFGYNIQLARRPLTSSHHSLSL